MTIEVGDTIGYHPVGADDVRQVGIVREVDGGLITVAMPDDPGIEEKVPRDRIKAHRKAGSIDVDTDTHYPVGPFEDVYDHGPVTVVEQVDRDGVVFYICLECGYLDDDVRRFAHEECDRADNPITQTWRERFGGDFPD